MLAWNSSRKAPCSDDPSLMHNGILQVDSSAKNALLDAAQTKAPTSYESNLQLQVTDSEQSTGPDGVEACPRPGGNGSCNHLGL